MVVGCSSEIDAKLALVGFLGNRFDSEVEIASGIICYCLPVFRILYRQRIRKFFPASGTAHTCSHHSVFPSPGPHDRHCESPQDGQKLNPIRRGQLLASESHYIDFDKSENAKSKRTGLPGHLGISTTFAKACTPSDDADSQLESGQIRTTTSVSVASCQAKDSS